MSVCHPFQTDWNAETYGAGTGGHTIYPPSESRLPEAGDAWREEVLADMGTTDNTDETTDDTSDSTDDTTTDYQIGGYATPTEGTLDWHEPLNQNFDDIEADMQHLLERIEQLE